MALKPTIHKFRIDLSDLDRNHYDALNLTVALHPSETVERMMARVLAACLNAQRNPMFCKGLSDSDEPDLWAHKPDGSIALWIDVGEPAPDRIKKASRRAEEVKVYCFNSKANVWWRNASEELRHPAVSVYQFPWPAMQTLASLVKRTTELTVMVSEGTLHVTAEDGECAVDMVQLDAGA